MKQIVCLCMLFMCIAAAGAFPIETAPLPSKQPLSGTTWGSAKAIDDANPPLTKEPRWEMTDLGYMYGYPITVIQEDNYTTTAALEQFANSEIALPASIGNATNATKIGEGGMVYL